MPFILSHRKISSIHYHPIDHLFAGGMGQCQGIMRRRWPIHLNMYPLDKVSFQAVIGVRFFGPNKQAQRSSDDTHCALACLKSATRASHFLCNDNVVMKIPTMMFFEGLSHE